MSTRAPETEPYLARLQTRMARGDSLEEAGARYGLSLWRAKATFVRAGLPIPKPMRRRVPLSDEVRALGVRIHAYLEQEDNASSTEVAAALGVTRGRVVTAIWPQDGSRLRPALVAGQKYSREAILIGLQAMSLLRGVEMGARGGVPVPATYWDAHRDPAVLPGAAVVRHRFDGWGRACETAGIPMHAGPTTVEPKRWTDEQCLAAAREFFAGGHGWASAAYTTWTQTRDAPSAATVISRLGPWPVLRDRLLG